MSKIGVLDMAEPIFILSCTRSGSTLMRCVLDTHPDVCSPGELHLGRLCDDLRHVIEHLDTAQLDGAYEQTERARKVNLEVKQLVSSMMNTYAMRKGKRIWCEKSPTNLDYLEALSDVFTDARYICLHRHAMDRVHSCMEFGRLKGAVSGNHGFPENPLYYIRNRNKISALVDSWVDKTSKLLAFERQYPSKCFRVKYESLVANPAEVLEALFSFLEIGWDSSLLESVFTQPHDHPRKGDTKLWFTNSIHTRSVGVSSNLSIRRIDSSLLEKMNGLLIELGYPTVGPDWSAVASTGLGVDQIPQRDAKDQIASDIEELFATYFPKRLQEHADKLQGFTGGVQFVVPGSGGGRWLIDLTERGANIVAGDGGAGSTITVSASTLLKIVNGKLNAAEAFAEGGLKVSGNLRRAVDLGLILLRA